jgi:Flp pilus assembly pilin Flp
MRDESAPSMVEYGLLIALVAMVVTVAAVSPGSSVSGLFNTTASSV